MSDDPVLMIVRSYHNDNRLYSLNDKNHVLFTDFDFDHGDSVASVGVIERRNSKGLGIGSIIGTSQSDDLKSV